MLLGKRLSPRFNCNFQDYFYLFCFVFQIDDDPNKPVYIATQGPLQHTVGDFWQVIKQHLVVKKFCWKPLELATSECSRWLISTVFTSWPEMASSVVSDWAQMAIIHGGHSVIFGL